MGGPPAETGWKDTDRLRPGAARNADHTRMQRTHGMSWEDTDE